MSFVRKLGRFLTASLLKLSLLVFATSLALSGVIGTPEPVLKGLEKSGIYDTLVPGFLDAASKQEGDNAGEDLPVDDPKIRKIIDDSFSPEYLQDSADKLVRGFYGWLNGDTTQPEFSVDLSSARQSLIQGLANYAEKRLLSLPACTPAQARELAAQEIDPFTADCRPPVVVSAEKKKLIKEFEKSEFLKDEELSTDTLTKDNPDKFSEELKGLPDSFQLMKTLPKIAGALALLSAAGLILLHDDKRRGIRQVGIILLFTGLFLLVSTLLFQAVYSRLADPESFDIDNASLKNSVIDLVGRLYNAFNRSLMIVSAAYTLVGGGTLGTLAYLNRINKDKPEQAKPKEGNKAEENPTEPVDKP